MFWLYCLPGRMVAHLNWLMPQKNRMNAINTARQKNSTLVHFAISSIFYLLAVNWLVDDKLLNLFEGRPSGPVMATPSPPPSSGYEASHDAPIRASTAAGVQRMEISDEGAVLGANPAVARALDQAFRTGRPARWKTSGRSGYALASEQQEGTGCRSMVYTVDDQPGWQSSPHLACPTNPPR